MGDFFDRRTILVRPTDQRTPIVWNDDACGVQQDADGPVLLVVGARISDEKCQRLAARYGLDAADVIAFRDSAPSNT